MEGQLFFISIWCGILGLIMRVITRSEEWTQKTWVTMILNGVFWATGGVILGMLLSSYFEKLDDQTMYSSLLAAVGLVVGAARGYLKAQDEKKRDALLQDNLEWVDTGFSAILLASLVMFFVVQAFKIPSGSMRMTFVEGDHLFVLKSVYGIPIPFTDKKVVPFRKITPGDIVIFRFPTTNKSNQNYGKDFIKRVIATEGHQVQIINKDVFVDHVKLNEPYAQHVDSIVFPGMNPSEETNFQNQWEKGDTQGRSIRDNFGPVMVPPGCIMVMGDNRDMSYDSRFWGPLPVSQIKGKAWLRYWGPVPEEDIKWRFWLFHWPLARVGFVH